LSKKSAKKTGKRRVTGTPGGPMDVSLLEQIVQLMSANDLNTVDVRDGDQRVILRRGAFVAPHASSGFATTAAPQAPALGGTGTSNPGLASGATTSAPATDSDAGMLSIKSPMVGTFYASSSPEAKPFVIVGSTVDEESDVCIIEAMKVFNNIKAECRGTIAKILVTNGQTVEFGQPLFLVKP
jgi:acetyl-CoA carboxylase biotin carboxyl carrier protein